MNNEVKNYMANYIMPEPIPFVGDTIDLLKILIAL